MKASIICWAPRLAPILYQGSCSLADLLLQVNHGISRVKFVLFNKSRIFEYAESVANTDDTMF